MTTHITINNTVPRIRYISNGVLATYTYPFAIFKNSDLKVYFGSTLQESTTYSVSGAGSSSGGSITLSNVPENGTIITLTRELPIERTSDFQEGGALRANTLNHELDYQIACQQQIADNLNRSMVLPPYAADTNVNLTLPSPNAGKAIVWNAAGTNLENSTVSVNAMESTLNGYKTVAEMAANTATTKATEAITQAQTATEQATIATQKATEASATLSEKANKDMDNLSVSGKESITCFGIPDYSAGVAKNIGITYTSETNGWIFAGRHTIAQNTSSTAKLIIDQQEFPFHYYNSSTGSNRSSLFMPVKKGSSYKYENAGDLLNEFIFYPCIGG